MTGILDIAHRLRQKKKYIYIYIYTETGCLRLQVETGKGKPTLAKTLGKSYGLQLDLLTNTFGGGDGRK